MNARLAAVGYRGPLARDGHLSQPGGLHQRARQGRSPGQRPRPAERSLQPLRCQRRTTRVAPAASMRPSASSGLDNLDQTIAMSNTLTHLHANRARNPRAIRARRPAGAADRSHRARRQHRRRRLIRHELGQPDAPDEHAVSRSSTTCRTRPAPMRCERASTSSTTTTASRIRVRSVAATRFRRWRIFWRARTTMPASRRRSASRRSRRRTRTSACTCRTNGKSTSRLTLNVGVRYDLQFLETINTDSNNVSPRVGVAWSPFASRRTLVRGSAGLFYDRVPLRAAGQRASSRPATRPTWRTCVRSASASRPRRRGAGVPRHPARRRCLR